MNCAEKQGGSYGESNDTEYGKGAGIVPEYGCHGIKDDPKVAPVTRERVLRMAKEMAIWAKMYMWKKFGHRRRSITILWFCVRGMPLFIGTVS